MISCWKAEVRGNGLLRGSQPCQSWKSHSSIRTVAVIFLFAAVLDTEALPQSWLAHQEHDDGTASAATSAVSSFLHGIVSISTHKCAVERLQTESILPDVHFLPVQILPTLNHSPYWNNILFKPLKKEKSRVNVAASQGQKSHTHSFKRLAPLYVYKVYMAPYGDIWIIIHMSQCANKRNFGAKFCLVFCTSQPSGQEILCNAKKCFKQLGSFSFFFPHVLFDILYGL